jgi:hypothetical protein
MVTSSGIRAFGTASLMSRIDAGGVEDFANYSLLSILLSGLSVVVIMPASQ